MNRVWLLIDVPYLAWRSYYSMRGLSFEEIETSVPYGVFRDIGLFQRYHTTSNIVFCFDKGPLLRQMIYKEYKSSREEGLTDEQIEVRKEINRQIKLLRREYLPLAGYKNILWKQGYEADDVIAAICRDLPKQETAVIISADHDFLQLLSDRVLVWSPATKLFMNHRRFTREWGVAPVQWVDVLAMAGCRTDDVVGIDGVGLKTACKFLQGKLKPTTVAYQNITAGNAIWERNRGIVKLPHDRNCGPFELVDDEVTYESWRRIGKKLGAKTLAEFAPDCARRRRSR